MMAPFSKCYGKISVRFCLTQENGFSQRFRFKNQQKSEQGFFQKRYNPAGNFPAQS